MLSYRVDKKSHQGLEEPWRLRRGLVRVDADVFSQRILLLLSLKSQTAIAASSGVIGMAL